MGVLPELGKVVERLDGPEAGLRRGNAGGARGGDGQRNFLLPLAVALQRGRLRLALDAPFPGT